MGVLPDWMIERDVKIEPFSPQQHRPGVISYGVTSYGYDVRVGYIFKVFSPIHGSEIDPKRFDPRLLETIDLTPQEHQWTDLESLPVQQQCQRCWCIKDEFTPVRCNADPKSDFIRIPPHSFVLAESFETFTIPRDVLCIVLGKSTYARCGLIVNVTPGEPDWTGKWTIEISNTTPLPVRVYAGEGIMQCVFIRTDRQELLLKDILRLYEIAEQKPDPEYVKAILHEYTCRTSYSDKKGKYQAQGGLTLPKVEGDKK